MASGREIELIRGDTRSINDAAFSPRGGLLATSYENGKVSVWDANNGKEVTSFEVTTPFTNGRNHSLSFSGDGHSLRWVKVMEASPFLTSNRERLSIVSTDIRAEFVLWPLRLTPTRWPLRASIAQ